MISYGQLLEQINLNCHLHNGAAFETEPIPPVSWTKKYTARKSLFSYHWAYVGTDIDSCAEAERLLSKLPKGITFVENTKIVMPLPEQAEAYHTVYERYSTTYIVKVSEAYAKKIVQGSRNKQIVISAEFDEKTLRKAEEFKDNILRSHADILGPLFTHGLQRYGCLDNRGFTDGEHGYSFQATGMKPLASEAQRVGLAIALSEYGASQLSDGQFYYIQRVDAGSISISKQSRILEKNKLKDW